MATRAEAMVEMVKTHHQVAVPVTMSQIRKRKKVPAIILIQLQTTEIASSAIVLITFHSNVLTDMRQDATEERCRR